MANSKFMNNNVVISNENDSLRSINNSSKLIHLRQIEEIPQPYQEIFSNYPCFNIVQSQTLDDILYTDNSLVISAPTGAGKTVLFELAIVRLLIACENNKYDTNFIKIVYICPLKALCEERLVDWHRKFSSYGLNCASVTGDSDNFDFHNLFNHNLIITTPEKWDSLTRKWRDNKKLVQLIKLFMIDEIHLLNEENRGATLEIIVCRMKTIQDSFNTETDNNQSIINSKIRFMALSATIPNIEDIAKWFGHYGDTKYFKFSNEVRPVKINKIVIGYPYNSKLSTPFKFDLSLNYKLQSLIMQYSHGRPTLIFCNTRKSVEITARFIYQNFTVKLMQNCKQTLLDAASTISDNKISDMLIHGVAYHHAGMTIETRRCIENVFRNGDLPVLITTSTLAMGVNLPAHLVIIKSTKYYNKGEFCDYPETSLLQMIGRAGRPQFDSTATALILTTYKDKEKFEKMIGGTQSLESNLHKHLTEHINAEVVLHTITDLDIAMQWLSSTFLYIRAKKNPIHYGLRLGLTSDQIDKKLLEMCQIHINKLVRAGMIVIDGNINIMPTKKGDLMAKYYIALETMKLFSELNGAEILQQILSLISRCHEFSEMCLRTDEKKCLNILNNCKTKRIIRFPLNGKIKTLDMKINCIIQAVFGCLDIYDFSLLSESTKIIRNGERISKCLIEYLMISPNTTCYSALLNSLILSKCFHVQMWENSPFVIKQLPGIGNVMSTQLVNAGLNSFTKILNNDARQIEMILNKKPPIGCKILEQVKHIPKYHMKLEHCSSKQIKLIITLENLSDIQKKSTVNLHSIMWLLVGDNLNNILLYEKYSHSFMLENSIVINYINIRHDEVSHIQANFISEDWIGIDCNEKFLISGEKSNQINSKTICKSDYVKSNDTYLKKFMENYINIERKKEKTQVNKESKFDEVNENYQAPFNSSDMSLLTNNNKRSINVLTNNTNHTEQREIIYSNELTETNKENISDRKNVHIKNFQHVDIAQNSDPSNIILSCYSNENVSKSLRNFPEHEIYENHIDYDNTVKNVSLQQFAFTPHKKIAHSIEVSEPASFANITVSDVEILHPENKQKSQRTGTTKKCIKWRSPLICSPNIKFVPNIDNESKNLNISNEISTESLESSSMSNSSLRQKLQNNSKSIKLSSSSIVKSSPCAQTQFPLCDRDYHSSKDENNFLNLGINKADELKNLSDLCSISFLENVGIIDSTDDEDNKLNVNLSDKIIESPNESLVIDYYSQLMAESSKRKLAESNDDVLKKPHLEINSSNNIENYCGDLKKRFKHHIFSNKKCDELDNNLINYTGEQYRNTYLEKIENKKNQHHENIRYDNLRCKESANSIFQKEDEQMRDYTLNSPQIHENLYNSNLFKHKNTTDTDFKCNLINSYNMPLKNDVYNFSKSTNFKCDLNCGNKIENSNYLRNNEKSKFDKTKFNNTNFKNVQFVSDLFQEVCPNSFRRNDIINSNNFSKNEYLNKKPFQYFGDNHISKSMVSRNDYFIDSMIPKINKYFEFESSNNVISSPCLSCEDCKCANNNFLNVQTISRNLNPVSTQINFPQNKLFGMDGSNIFQHCYNGTPSMTKNPDDPMINYTNLPNSYYINSSDFFQKFNENMLNEDKNEIHISHQDYLILENKYYNNSHALLGNENIAGVSRIPYNDNLNKTYLLKKYFNSINN